ncbi:MAG: zf-HC2 domain-containing protein [Gammaproteobacteria bacterium]|nr:zf-HC2 domain-containing protein [Gammaproteobacteria bacterium]
MFKCRDIHDHASDYLEKRLSLWGRIQFRWHLFICVHCRNFIRQMRTTVSTLAGLKKSPDSGAIDNQVALLLRQRQSSSSKSTSKKDQ